MAYKLQLTVKLKNIWSSFVKKSQKEVTYFKNSKIPITCKPFLYKQCLAILLLLFIGGSLFLPLPVIDKSLVINTAVTKQNTTIVAGGSPIKWTALIKKSDITKSNYLLSLPKSANNVKISTISQQQAGALLQSPEVEQVSQKQRQSIAKANQSKIFYIIKIFNGINKFILSSLDSTAEMIISTVNDKIKNTKDAVAVNLLKEIEKPDELVSVTYETPAPEISEQETDTGKVVIVSSEEEVATPELEQVPLTDVLAFTNIPEIYKVGQESKIKIKWTNNDNKNVTFKAYDTNNNGKLDYVEWTIPHLSTQTFEIIFISKAFQLDNNKEILADIYDTVKTQDGNYATLIDGQYIRVTFEKSLTNANDITLVAKPTEADRPVTINAYTVDTNQLVATFFIDKEGRYQELIPELASSTDVFDLKITGNIDVDYIVDPVGDYALNFDGGKQITTSALSPAMSGHASMTVAAWVKTVGTTYPENNNGTVVGLNEVDFGLWVKGDTNKVDFPGSGAVSITSLNPGTWYFIVGTYDQTDYKIYVNGMLENTFNSPGRDFGTLFASIGYVRDQGRDWYHFVGAIDEPLIFNRALSSGEIDDLWNSGSGLYGNVNIAPFTSGFVAGYHLDEGSGTYAVDFSGNGNAGTVAGGSGGVSCGTITDQSTCDGTAGCTSSTNDCSVLDEGTCNSTGGCNSSYNNTDCSGLGEGDCNFYSGSGCSSSYSAGDCNGLDEGTCNSYSSSGCSSSYNTGDCSGMDEGTCSSTGGCSSSYNTGDCSGFDEGTCNSYSGQCTTNYNYADCGDYDEATCNANSGYGCSPSYTDSCDTYDNTDESTCTGAGCSWNDPDCSGMNSFSYCNGGIYNIGFSSCSGNYSYYSSCSGNYSYYSSCSGNYNYYNSCSGSYDAYASCSGEYFSCTGTIVGNGDYVAGKIIKPVLPPDIITGIVAHYSMDETSGVSINDSIGTHDIVASVDSTNMTTTGLISGALTTSSGESSDKFLDLTLGSLSSNFAADESWTISLWQKYPNVSSNNRVGIFKTTNTNFIFWIYNGSEINGMDSGIWTGSAGSGVTASDNTWYLHTIIRTPTTLKVYVNETLVIDATGNPPPAPDVLDYIRFGSTDSVDDGVTGSALVDEVRIYNRALESADVVALYNGGAGTTEDTLVPTNVAPNAPTLVSPVNASYATDNAPTLSATYSDSDADDVGITDYRISSSSLADCIINTNVIAWGTSSTTASNSATTSWTSDSSMGSDATYYWCAQNNDGVLTSAWTQMGSFTLDTATPTISVTSPTSGTYYTSTAVPFYASTTDTNKGSIVPNLDSSLVVWWTMDEINSPWIMDHTGNNINLGISGSIQAAGKFGQGMSFDGVNDSLYTGSRSSLNFGTNDFSVSLWIKTGDSMPVWATEISKGNPIAAQPSWALMSTNNSNVVFRVRDVSTLNERNANIIAQEWTHVVALKYGDVNNDYTDLYINGVKDGSTVSSAKINVDTTEGLQLGVNQNWFKGSLDDVMIFNRKLTTDEITALFDGTAINHSSTLTEASHTYKAYAQDLAGNIATSDLATFTVDSTAPSISYAYGTQSDSSYSTSNTVNVIATTSDANGQHSVFTDWNNSLVGWWKLNGDVTDSSGNSNNGTNNGATATAGKLGQAMSFDEAGYINTPYTLDGKSIFTISLWFKPATPSLDDTQYILSNGDSYFRLYKNQSSEFYLQGLSTEYRYIPELKFDENVWNNIIVTYDGSYLNFYKNNVLKKSFATTGTVSTGGTLRFDGRNFTSSIDDVMIFNRALSSAEVASIYNASSTQYSNTFENLAEGSYTFKTYAQDLAGNVSSEETRTFTVDTIHPNASTNLTWSETSPYNDTTITASWTKSDSADLANQKIQFYTGNSCNTTTGTLIDLASTTTETRAFTGSDNTTYTFKITSIDTATNETVSACSSAMSIVLDNTPPTTNTNLNGYTTNTWTSSNVTVDLTCNDNVGGSGCDKIYACIDDGSACNPTTGTAYDSPKQFTYSAEGITTLRWKSKDINGNWQTTEGTTTVKIDKSAPATVSDAGAFTFGGWTNDNVNITLLCADGSGSGCAATLYCTDSLNTCTPNTPYIGSFEVVASEGPRGIYVRYLSTDLTSNVESISYKIINIIGPAGGGSVGGTYIPPTTTPEETIPAPVEDSGEAKSENSNVINQLTEQIANLAEQVAGLINPPTQPEIVYPPIEEAVPVETPTAFQGLDPMVLDPLSGFDLSLVGISLDFFVDKLPQFNEVLNNLSIDINNVEDIKKLSQTKLYLPGLTQTVLSSEEILKANKLAENDLISPENLQTDALAAVQGVPLAELSVDALAKIPTNIVFASTAEGLIDYVSVLAVDTKGNTEQRIKTVAGKQIELVIKPENPASRVTGFVILKNLQRPVAVAEKSSKSKFSQFLGASLSVTNPAPTAEQSSNLNGLLIEKFEYTETKAGIYTAKINSPTLEGQYEITTVVEYKDKKLVPTETKLITVVDPEGYIYQKIAGMEARIQNATVSIYWQNPDTKEFELWLAEKFMQKNPILTDNTGKYSFLVPQGIYYLSVKASNYYDYKSDEFVVKEDNGIVINIELKNKNVLPAWFNLELLIVALLVTIALFCILIYIKKIKIINPVK